MVTTAQLGKPHKTHQAMGFSKVSLEIYELHISIFFTIFSKNYVYVFVSLCELSAGRGQEMSDSLELEL